MQALAQTLEELKDLHQKVFGRAAPEMGPHSLLPFPPGVDPIEHARTEAQHVARLFEQLAFVPKPDAWSPPADSFVSENAVVVHIEIPGISREDVKVHVVGHECIVRGSRKPPQCAEGMRPMALERPWGSFERRFMLPTGSRSGEISARCIDGVLELNIPVDSVSLPEEQIEIA